MSEVNGPARQAFGMNMLIHPCLRSPDHFGSMVGRLREEGNVLAARKVERRMEAKPPIPEQTGGEQPIAGCLGSECGARRAGLGAVDRPDPWRCFGGQQGV